jgi:Predicted dehydrogenases and related proteins
MYNYDKEQREKIHKVQILFRGEVKMIRIGCVNIDVSHPKAFCDYLMKGSRARYTGVYNDGFRGDDEVDAFISQYNIEKRYYSLAEMAGNVDIGFIQGCNWDKHIEYAKPFIDRGKPVFIDKPIAGSLRDCMALEKLASEGKVILGSSSVRYAFEIQEFLAKPEEERGKILNIFGTAGVDEFNYAIHIVEGICSLNGSGAVSVRFIGRSSMEGKVCESFFIRFSNGVTAVYNTFQGTWMPFDMVIMTTKTSYSFRIDSNRIYGAMLDRICDFMETGKKTIAPVSDITESIKIMLAARISRERNGEEIMLSDIPVDDPGYDGYKFEKEYAASARKIYL